MSCEFYKHNVPQLIIRKWSDDTKHVHWYNPFTKEEKPERTLTSLYRESLTGLNLHEMMAIRYLEANFISDAKSLYEGEFYSLKAGRSVTRSEILFLYLGNPVYQQMVILLSGESKSFDLSSYSGDKLKAMKIALHSSYIQSILGQVMLEEFLLYDLQSALLYAPPTRSFVIGGNPVVISNPSIGTKALPYPFNLVPYYLKGTFIVLPLSPDKALCLYDKDVYSLSSNLLSDKDVDIINMEEICSCGENDGVVCKGEREYVDELLSSYSFFEKKGGICCDGIRYPFDTRLSVIVQEGKCEVEQRSFVRDVSVYDNKRMSNIDIMNADGVLKKRIDFFMNRFRDGVYTG